MPFLLKRYENWKTDKAKQAGLQSSQTTLTSFLSQHSYTVSHPRQIELTQSIVSHLIVQGNLPISLAHQPWFKEFMKCVDKKFKMPSRYKVESTITKMYNDKQAILKEKLQSAQYVSLTLDMWSDRRMRSFMGMTVHFVDNNLHLCSFLLDFAYFTGRHTAINISNHCASVIDTHKLASKIFFIITDNATNMVKAFQDFREFNTDGDGTTAASSATDESISEHPENENNNSLEVINEKEMDFDQDNNHNHDILLTEIVDDFEVMDDNNMNIILENLPFGNIKRKRLSCAIHTLQLVILDGLKTSKFLTNLQAKTSRLSNLIHTSNKFSESFFNIFKTTVPKTTNTRWNSLFIHFAAVAKLDSNQLNKVLLEHDYGNCTLTKREYDMLREVVAILEPAYDATLLMEEANALISLTAPTVSVLYNKWSAMIGKVLFSDSLLRSLLQSMEQRFTGLLMNIGLLQPTNINNDCLDFHDTAYIVAAALDPEFKLSWLSRDDIKTTVTGLDYYTL